MRTRNQRELATLWMLTLGVPTLVSRALAGFYASLRTRPTVATLPAATLVEQSAVVDDEPIPVATPVIEVPPEVVKVVPEPVLLLTYSPAPQKEEQAPASEPLYRKKGTRYVLVAGDAVPGEVLYRKTVNGKRNEYKVVVATAAA